jgi:hypothetical protein
MVLSLMAFGRFKSAGLHFFLLSQEKVSKEMNLTCQGLMYKLSHSQGI